MINKFNDILNPIAELLAKKRNDYGDNYELGRDKRGPVSFYLRIEDKLNRIEQLDSNTAQVKDESVLDTLNDIIGYVTLEINYRREKALGELLKCGKGYCYKPEIRLSGKRCDCADMVNERGHICVWQKEAA